ncbi:Hypothetical protein A7982_00919 [Minicystis rosea]|nr:Hypothetical protein A7982_00919 [Minicystis rosea]
MSTLPTAPAADLPASDEARILTLCARLCEHWNAGDGAAYASSFTEDADYVTFFGTRSRGRRAIGDEHQALFDGLLQGWTIMSEIRSIRFVSPDIAVAHGVGLLLAPWEKRRPTPPFDKIQTYVLVRRNGDFRITAFHNTRIAPPPASGFGFWMFSTMMRIRRALFRVTGW